MKKKKKKKKNNDKNIKKNDKNIKENNKKKKNTLPSHLFLPTSLYPNLQGHKYVPGKFKHLRSPSQSWPDGPRPIKHSSMSNKNTENFP
ncbi:hypothetical protein ElyMa_000654600 [Elysia marginata]|uniref:Uncharacterized protein n=1 Tax=Elysia marginata TaxID=1093978 RepID=A0AAV4GGD3_9GAST|nr:hypothetical protein ElyMa_000654600 [Elysia marginata]